MKKIFIYMSTLRGLRERRLTMKKLLLTILFLCLVCSVSAQTRPNWAQLTGTPFRCTTEFGANGDDAIDDTEALQKAVNTGKVVIPPGTYLVSRAINIPNNCGLIAQNAGTWAPVGSRNVVLKYIGATGANTAIINVSAYNIGVETGTSARSNVVLKGLSLDGGDLAAYGVWGYYVTNESCIESITVINTNTSGIRINGPIYYSRFSDLTAKSNNGNGIFIGGKSGNINGNTFFNLHAGGNGTSYLEADFEDNAGIVLNFHTRNSVIGLTSEVNTGPGVYLGCTGSANSIYGAYIESNNITGSAPIGIYINAISNSRSNTIENLYLAGYGESNAQTILASGSASARYLINNFYSAYIGSTIVDNTKGALSIVSQIPGGLGNRLPYGKHSIGGTVYVGEKLKVHAYDSTTDNTRGNLQTHSYTYDGAWTTEPVQIATFTVRCSPPSAIYGTQATLNFSLGLNEYSSGSCQTVCIVEGIALLLREGIDASNTIATATILSAYAINHSGAYVAANNITADEISFSILSGGGTDTQVVGMFFTRKNHARTYNNLQVSLTGLLKDASTGTIRLGIGVSNE